MSTMSKQAYAEMYGPTVGDRLRLADTHLLLEVEEDRTVYGDEVKFGGGKVIREIVEKTGAKIDIQDDGTVKVASSSGPSIEAAVKWIKSIVSEPEVGEIYDGKVVKVVEFGAFVNFFGSRDGLVHVSELAPRRVAKVTDVVNEGDAVKVKLLGFDNRGKVRLSMKQVDQATGEDISKKQAAEDGSAGDGAPQGE